MVAYSFKPRFVVPICLGLGIPYALDDVVDAEAPKRQTIRAVGRRRHARPGETIQLYTGMRTRHCRKIGEARCVSVQEIEIRFGAVIDTLSRGDRVSFGSLTLDDGRSLDDFARSDGFPSWVAMKRFWGDEHGGDDFQGLLIRWEPL